MHRRPTLMLGLNPSCFAMSYVGPGRDTNEEQKTIIAHMRIRAT